MYFSFIADIVLYWVTWDSTRYDSFISFKYYIVDITSSKTTFILSLRKIANHDVDVMDWLCHQAGV